MYYFVIFVVYIIINIIAASLFCDAAELKGYDVYAKHIKAKCIWLGIIGWLYVIALPDKSSLDLSQTKSTCSVVKPSVSKSEEPLKQEKEQKQTPSATSINAQTGTKEVYFDDGRWVCPNCSSIYSSEIKKCYLCGFQRNEN